MVAVFRPFNFGKGVDKSGTRPIYKRENLLGDFDEADDTKGVARRALVMMPRGLAGLSISDRNHLIGARQD